MIAILNIYIYIFLASDQEVKKNPPLKQKSLLNSKSLKNLSEMEPTLSEKEQIYEV